MSSDASPPDWAATLRARRNAAHLSRKTLAAQAGLSVKMIEAVENGRRRPGPDTRAAIDRVIASRTPDPSIDERLARLEAIVLGAA
jgi:transcriptional regulator with XRE-family HTH domain